MDKEPAFDAADMMRMGADVIIQHSAVTNKPGKCIYRREMAQVLILLENTNT